VDIYSALDVVVFPSHLRGIGRPGFEAAACGRPVVATTTTGNSEIVVDGMTGLLVPQKNPPKLAEAIIRLLNDKDLREKMGKAGLLHAKENFDYRKNARRVMALYESILVEKKKFEIIQGGI
jgi:glycosyltransferase involved in cell wall biosynthesis